VPTLDQISNGGSEHANQAAVFEWCEMMTSAHPELRLIFAIPNGARTSISVAKRLKAEGLRSGVPDLFLPVARGGYHGLFVEMKTKTGVVSHMQKGWHAALVKEGFQVCIARGSLIAIALIEQYLKGAK
jgi:VRR-NUC domain-containing protein